MKKLSKEEFRKLSTVEQVEYLYKVDKKFAKEREEAVNRFWENPKKN
jgi:hypothetical protein